MKKTILASAALIAATFCYSQTVNYSPALTATSYTWFTNDEQNPTVLQRLNYYECIAGPVYSPALHIGTTPLLITDFNFAPGYNYTVQIQGTTTVGGNITTPPSNLTFSLALWPGTANPNIYNALNPFPGYYEMETYPGSMPPSLYKQCFNFESTDDLFGNWLVSYLATSTIPVSSTQVFSVTTPKFQATSTTNQLTLELGPVLGDEPGLDDLVYGNCACLLNPTRDQTNAVLTINQIILTATAIQGAQINGSSLYYFSSSQTGGGGTITAAPGATVTVTVSASGAPGYNYQTECNISGAYFSTGGQSITVTNGSNSATFVMPASGSVTWSGGYSYTSSAGGGSISVH